jgi:hypothetical protein
MERVEWIEDLDVRGFYTQGIVSAGAITHTFIASCRAEDFHPILSAGSPAAQASFSPCASFRDCSAASFSMHSKKLFSKASFTFSAKSNRSKSMRLSWNP